MSYILDALKRAESERKLGKVPGMHAQGLPLIAGDKQQAPWRRPAYWLAALLLLIGVAILAQFALQVGPFFGKESAPGLSGDTAVASASPAPASTTNTAASDKGIPEDKLPAPMAAATMPPPPPIIQRQAVPPAVRKTEVVKANNGTAGAAIDGKTVRDAAATAKPSPAPIAPAAPPALALRELPAHVRSGLPAVVVGGYIYSPNPADRSIVINGRLVRESQQVSPGLILEQMMPREAVLNYQGTRYRIAY